ncbi:MAG: tRNA pseudouridine(54/55) synthase Pus10 [Desulfurococcales archaeon]|nr:tRNA pseudouridine(54/55) synthase Pus10 [Desulfurococcales archaeon]
MSSGKGKGVPHDIIDKAKEILKRYALCDTCLGRLFATYGLGISNAERGRALKTVISMNIHSRILSGDRKALEDLEILARNGGGPFLELARRYVGEVTVKRCFICGNKLQDLIGKLTVQAIKQLGSVEGRTFLVGVKKGSKYEEVENSVALTHSLTSWESIRREIKREVGKRIQSFTGMKPSFRNPDILILIDLNEEQATAEPLPLHILGSYLKLGRYITQMKWIGKEGRNYTFSVEESVRKIVKPIEGEDVVFHASGREDADARMLGGGRPLVVEVKKPRKRSVDLRKLSTAGSSPPWVVLKLTQYVPPETVERVKSTPSRKVYRAITYSNQEVTEDDVEAIEEVFKDAEITQRTPSRVLRRRKDIVRIRKVYGVKGALLTPHVVEFLIYCDGGLYVKELVSGDGGRTKPSFSEVTGKSFQVIFLDVLKHEGVSAGA